MPDFPPILPAVGGLYGFNLESLGTNKTLTVGTDEIYQYLDPTANIVVTLSTVGASAGDRFVIRNNDSYYSTRSIEVKQGANSLDLVYANDIVEFIFDGTDWVAGGVGTGQYGSLNQNIGIGYKANATTEGVAIGYDARAYTYGVALGKSAYGFLRGLALGYQANSGNRYYSIALGYRSRCTRTAETAISIDGLSGYKNQVVQGRYYGYTFDATPYEIPLGSRGGQRFDLRAASAIAFKGLVVATTQATPGTPNVTSSWEVAGLIKRDADNNTTLVGVTQAVLHQDGGAAAWSAVFSADDTNEALILTVTGAAGTTIRWAAFIDAVEIVW